MGVLLNIYATMRSIRDPDFPHVLRGRRDRTDAALAPHLQGFAGFVMRGGEREMTPSLYHVVRHVQRVRNHLSLEVEERDFVAMTAWAWSANAIVLFPDGSVRNPDGAVLVDPDTGQAEGGAIVPYPHDALERKKRHDMMLAHRGIAVASTLPPVIGAGEVSLRAPVEVAQRALALLVVAIRGASLGRPDPMSPSELRRRVPQAFEALSPREQAFMESADPPQQEAVDHAWRYEALLVLEWALGLVEALPAPSAVCDAGKIAGVLTQMDRDALLASATLRPTGAILDALDEHVRLHWASREATRQGTPPPADLDPGVLQERHHALNWLVRFEDAPWDEVETPT